MDASSEMSHRSTQASLSFADNNEHCKCKNDKRTLSCMCLETQEGAEKKTPSPILEFRRQYIELSR